MSEVRRSGFIAVLGRANAGKSTLVNRIVGSHVAIVSPVAQTTRRTVRAIARRDDAQLVFVDLPGSQKPMDRMTERMQAQLEQSLGDVDAVLWVVDASVEPRGGERVVAELAMEAGVPVVVAATKVDRANKQELLPRLAAIDRLAGEREYRAMVPVSGTTGDGVEQLLDELVAVLPEGPAWFGDEDVVDMRIEERIAEYVREAALGLLHDELPHATAVTVEELEEDDEDPDRLIATCTLWVERESQVGIVVGKRGAGIRELGTRAREVIVRELGRRVHLDIRVKVRRRWRDDDAWLASAGL